jgi:hypothetical protein
MAKFSVGDRVNYYSGAQLRPESCTVTQLHEDGLLGLARPHWQGNVSAHPKQCRRLVRKERRRRFIPACELDKDCAASFRTREMWDAGGECTEFVEVKRKRQEGEGK